jgi:hypothetical protein
MKTILLIATIGVLVRFSGAAAPLTEGTFTEIIRDVNTLSADGNAAPAKVSDVLQAPGRVRTGPESRAELTAPDQTITRVGANTVFSFADSGRTLNLEQGNVLFHAPKGLGGGTIKSGGAAAAVLGTTLIVSATADGGFKVIMLEGTGKVTLPNGKSVTLKAGQMVFVLPGGTSFSAVLDINLAKLVAGSLLINGFSHPLSSLPLIQAAIDQQNSQLASGNATDTGVPADHFASPRPPGNGLNSIDPGTYQNAAHPPLTQNQLSQLINSHDPAKVVFGNPGGRGFIPVGGPIGQ